MGICIQHGDKVPITISQNMASNTIKVSGQDNVIKIEAIKINSNLLTKTSFPEDEYEDMPEWPGERYKGYGIKKMKAYKCNLNIDDLNRLREDFWNSRKYNKNNWKILHQACIYDHIKSEDFLKSKEFTVCFGCINVCKDNKGVIYRIPNYCINDPYFEHEILPVDNHKEKYNKLIDVIVSNLYLNEITKIKINNNATGLDLKEAYAKEKNIDLSLFKIKFIFSGDIIKDNDKLYQHKIDNGFKVQVIINKID